MPSMYTIILTDSSGTLELPELEVPFSESTIESARDVQTLDYNVYTSFIAQKRVWEHAWSYLPEADFDAIKAYYDRQFSTYQYPRISIDGLDVDNVVVRMTLTPRRIIDGCGNVADVTVTFRETRQMPAI